MFETLPNIRANIIPHSTQRYPTVGDWFTSFPGRLDIRVSALGNEDYEFLVLLHELVEAYLCRRSGVSQQQVDGWDIACLEAGTPGEPGAHPDAPYHKQHMQAELIERACAQLLEVDWAVYDASIEQLFKEKSGEEVALGDSSSSE